MILLMVWVGIFPIDICGWRAGRDARARAWRVAGAGAPVVWKSYVEQKLQTCRTYAATPSSSTEPVCHTLSC